MQDVGYSLKLEGNNGSTIEVTDLKGNGPFTYTLDHVHFHSPCEHTFEGKRYDLEMHMVHKLEEKGTLEANYHQKLAVIGVLFQVQAKEN